MEKKRIITTASESELRMTGVYKIVNKLNGKVYYGSTTESFRDRLSDHCSQLWLNKHPCRHLQSAYNINGPDAFEYSIVLICDPEEVKTQEQLLLDKYWDNGKQCYNSSRSAYQDHMSGRKQTEQAREKGRQAKLGEKNPAAKLTWAKVDDIRMKYSTGNYTELELGLENGITLKAISLIVLNKRWKRRS